jgi:NADPH2:quinone reductase
LAEDFSRIALKDLPLPEPGDGEVRVRVEAASLNFPDLLMLRGGYQFKPTPPFTVGMDLAGTVDAVGSGVAMQPGQRVAGGTKTGAFAEYAIRSASALHPVPGAISAPHAAAYPAAYTTAYVSLVERGQLQAGETSRPWGVWRRQEWPASMSAAPAQPLSPPPPRTEGSGAPPRGAHHVIVLGPKPGDAFRDQVKALTNGKGADVIVDTVGDTSTNPRAASPSTAACSSSASPAAASPASRPTFR